MNTAVKIDIPMNQMLPPEMRAVLTIFNADGDLQRKALPHVNIERQSIDWPAILANDFGGGHSVAIAWSRALWADRVPPGLDLFERSIALDDCFRQIIIKAVVIRWGLRGCCDI